MRHRDRCQHRLRRQAHRHQLHHLPCQQQGPAAHLGERPAFAQARTGGLFPLRGQSTGPLAALEPARHVLSLSRLSPRSGRASPTPAWVVVVVLSAYVPPLTLLCLSKFLFSHLFLKSFQTWHRVVSACVPGITRSSAVPMPPVSSVTFLPAWPTSPSSPWPSSRRYSRTSCR